MLKENLKDLIRRESLESMKYTLKEGSLKEGQQKALFFSLWRKKSLISFPTGKGKTYIFSAFTKTLTDAYPDKLGLILIENSASQQLIRDIEALTGKEVLYLTGDTSYVLDTLDSTVRQHSIIVVTYEAIINPIVNKLLFLLKDSIISLVVDESLNLGNEDSLRRRMVGAMAPYIEYIQFLTATPLRVSPEQFISQLNILNKDIVPSILNPFKKFNVGTNEFEGWKDLTPLYLKIYDTYFYLTNNMLDVENKVIPEIIEIKPSKEQIMVPRHEIRTCKSSVNHLYALKQTILNLNGEKGIIYVNRDQLKKAVMLLLESMGIKFTILDGKFQKKLGLNRLEEQDKFENDKYQVVITNITTGLNLDSDFIYFYEMTVDMVQMLGRTSRGYKDSVTTLYLPITINTDEERFFIENIYGNSQILKQACRSNVKAITDIKRRINGEKI